MSIQDEIRAAIGAHGLWKARLKDAIHTGACDVAPAAVRVDNQCKFGQWLYGPTVPGAAKASPEYHECVALHARFHVAAAHVLELALAGHKLEAEAAMQEGTEFAAVSHKLTDAMLRWQTRAA